MKTALVYVLTSIALPLIFLALGKIDDKPRPDPNVYTYPKKIVWAVFMGWMFLFVMGLVIEFVLPLKPSRNPAIADVLWIALLVCLLLAGLHIRTYRIALAGSVLHVRSMFFRKTVELESVRRFAIIHGGRGGQFLELYDAQNNKVFSVADTIQDFTDLVSLLHHQVAHHDISFESRDKWGEWTRSRYDDAARMRDQKKRKLDLRNAALLSVAALAILAIVRFVLVQIRLL
jgi:hypothetical protein